MKRSSETPVRIESEFRLEKYVGKRVELDGMVSDARIPYMHGIDLSGLERFRGQRLLVSGILRCTVISPNDKDSVPRQNLRNENLRAPVYRSAEKNYWLEKMAWGASSFSVQNANADTAHSAHDEPDILETSQKNPAKVYTSGSEKNAPWKLARYGDPDLAKAIDALSDISRPWTVPKIIRLFEKESEVWQKKLQRQIDAKSNQMWPGWEEEEKRCGHLARLLAASRDPRAGLILGNALENPSLTIRISAQEGLFLYFLSDSRYHQLPQEKPKVQAFTNVLPENRRQVLAWWAINQDELKLSQGTISNHRRISVAQVDSIRLELEQPSLENILQIRVHDFVARNYGKTSVSCDVFYVADGIKEHKIERVVLKQESRTSEIYAGELSTEKKFVHGTMAKVVYEGNLRMPLSAWYVFYYH